MLDGVHRNRNKHGPNSGTNCGEDDISLKCQNMALSLWGNGVGSQWSTGSITRSDAAYAAIGVSREKERIVGFIKAGYPERIPSITKKAVEEIRAYLP